MCGIIGSFTHGSYEEVLNGLEMMRYRGRDHSDIYDFQSGTVGHLLHSLSGEVKQPFTGEGIFAANCEIYNYREIAEEENINCKNDSELLFRLIEKKGIEEIDKILNRLDGVYAFFYWKDDKIILARDILGVKPLFFNRHNFAFASERKALPKHEMEELNPRKILRFDLKEKKARLTEREFFHTGSTDEAHEEIIDKTGKLFDEAVRKRLPEKDIEIGVLFSGGIDSTLIAKRLKDLGVRFRCYTAGFHEEGTKEPEDITYAKRIAEDLDLDLEIRYITREDIEKYLKKLLPLIEDSNVVKTGVALPFYISCEMAKKDNVKLMFSGLGSEEIFAGYQRHRDSSDINEECISGLLNMHERDLYRDDVVSMAHNMELRLPFLDKNLIRYALQIPPKYKLDKERDKIIIRETAEDIPDYVRWRKKRAAQYGSRFDNAIKKLSKRNGYRLKADYLKSFMSRKKPKLGALFSSGKDSSYALWVMMKQGHEISCLITMRSRNKYSWMFHTPNIELADLQAEASGIPLIKKETGGEKEKELEDMKDALKEAKERYGIEGIVTGALYSEYQKERVEKVCSELGLKVYSPLWHINQEKEMRQLLRNGFRIILSSVAAEGLDSSWLGKEISEKDIDSLMRLKEKLGINVAGEGGEFESLVIDAPFFRKSISITDSDIMGKGLNAFFIVKDASIKNK
ncbi:MAG: diphthine--ammonia ligase [Nanobdellota archaeon]